MINLHFHWTWLLMALIIIIGVCIASPYLSDNNSGIGGAVSAAVGCFIILVTLLIALVLGGIFIW